MYRNINFYFTGNGRSRGIVEDGSHHNNTDNIYLELNNQPSELLQTVKDLKAELQNVKEDNERILRAQEELNQILLDKLHNEGKDKRKEHESESQTISYKRKCNVPIPYYVDN